MSDCSDEHLPANPIYSIYAVRSSKSVAFTTHFIHYSCAMKLQRSVKPQQFILLLLIVAAATLGCRVAVRTGFGDSDSAATRVWGYGYGFGSELKQSKPLDFKLFNSTLLKLAEVEVGERKQWEEIDKLLKGNRPAVTMRRFSNMEYRDRFLNGRSGIITLRSPEYTRFQNEFRQSLRDWARRKRFEPEIMDQLVDQVKVPIDKHNNCHVSGSRTKYESCAVVGNSGILLNKEYGGLIDSHEAVIRLNNARIMSYEKNVGSKTTFSFVNSNILHLCTRRDDCFCHPYGRNVPIVMYMCQPAQFLDYVVCNASHRSPLIVTDPRFDMLCSRIVKYYSLKRFALKGTNTSFEQWNSAHDGSLFHYSSGMQAVTLALGVCDRVSLFGFGKSSDSKHHYHTNQKKELQLHDYEAEYEFYRDLVQKTNMIPFLPEKFRFPPVVIHS